MLHTISRHESYPICAAASVGGSAPCAARRQSSQRKRRRNCRPLRFRRAGALQRDLSSDIWRGPIGHSPTRSRNAAPSSVNFPHFCIAGEETHDLASRLQRQCGRKPKRGNVTLSAVGLVLALSMPGWAQQLQRTLPTQTVTLSGTVETMDRGKRVVNSKTPDGKFETVDVPPGANRFDELKVGDKVSITYNNTVSARLKQPGEAPVNTATGTTTAGQGERPGGTASQERVMTVTITGIDKSASSISFTGPERMEIQPARRRSGCA